MQWKHVVVTLVGLMAAGCAGTQTFPGTARSGDTVLLPLGWNQSLTRGTVTVAISPAGGSRVTLGPSDPRIRGLIRLYPDPASRLIVGTETAQGLGVNAAAIGARLRERVSGANREWWLTVLCLDLPPDLPAGPAVLAVAGPDGSPAGPPIALEILEGSGAPTGLAGLGLEPAQAAEALAALERAAHATLVFRGPVVPHAIQVTLTRTPGVGAPWLVNPRGDLKNMSWADDGTTIRVLLTPTTGRTPGDLLDFTIVVAGELAGLRVGTVRGYDRSGTAVAGLTATLED